MQNSNYIDLLSKIEEGCNSFTLTQIRRIQRTNWCILLLDVPENVDCFNIFADYCDGQFKNTAVSMRYSRLNRDDSAVYICTVEKNTEGNFSKKICPPPQLIDAVMLLIPKNLDDDMFRNAVKEAPQTHRIPSLSPETKKLSASQIISTNLVSATIEGRIGIHSYSNVSQAKEKLLNSMRTSLRDNSKIILKPGDVIPTFWGFTLSFLPLSEKKRNFWITGPSNAGKSLFSRMLKKRFLAGCINAGNSTHSEISKLTQIIILDEFKANNAYQFPFVNLLCDNAFGFKHLYANHFTTAAAIVIVLANRSFRETYPQNSKQGEDIWQQLGNRFVEIDLVIELGMQGISIANYAMSKYKVSQKEIDEIYEQDRVDTLTDETVLDTYTINTGSLVFDVCTVCGSRISIMTGGDEDSIIQELGLMNVADDNDNFIEEEEKEEAADANQLNVNISNFQEDGEQLRVSSLEGGEEEIGEEPISETGSDNLTDRVNEIIARANNLQEEAEDASTNTRERLQDQWEEVKEEAASLLGPLLGRKRKNREEETEAESFI